MANIIDNPLDILSKREVNALYESKGLLPENNILNVTPDDIALCHKHWPETIQLCVEIAAKAYETFIIERSHLIALLGLRNIQTSSWRQHFILDRCVLHLLQIAHGTISMYHEHMENGMVDPSFYEKLQMFGGRYRCLAPNVPVAEYFHLFNIWMEMHMDCIVLSCKDGPVSADEKKIIQAVWQKLIDSVKVHFVYGWHHKKSDVTRDEAEYFAKLKATESTPYPWTRLRNFFIASIDEKAVPVKKTTPCAKPPSSNNDSTKAKDVPLANSMRSNVNSREEEIVQSAPIEIFDITIDFLES